MKLINKIRRDPETVVLTIVLWGAVLILSVSWILFVNFMNEQKAKESLSEYQKGYLDGKAAAYKELKANWRLE